MSWRTSRASSVDLPVPFRPRKHFWDVRDGTHVIVIELVNESYDRLIVDVNDPRATVDTINGAVSRHHN